MFVVSPPPPPPFTKRAWLPARKLKPECVFQTLHHDPDETGITEAPRAKPD